MLTTANAGSFYSSMMSTNCMFDLMKIQSNNIANFLPQIYILFFLESIALANTPKIHNKKTTSK